MEYQLLRFRIDHIIDLIIGGQLALPDFQRDFIWGPSKVNDLLQSIAREWPIGSLLMLEGPNNFASKPIELGPETNQANIKYYLLDGQQRITSIFHAIRDLSDVVYYIDLKKIMNESLDEDFIFHQKRTRFEKYYPSLKEQAQDEIIKISDIYETEYFFEWLSFLDDEYKRKEYTKIRRNYLYGLNTGVYNVPSTVLPSDVNFSALSKIFEGINTNSVRLTTSDLLVAANLPKGVNLRKMWKEFTDDTPAAIQLDFELIDILKICALIEREIDKSTVKGIKQSDLIRIDPLLYKNHWDIACKQIKEALEYSAQHLGVLNKSMLPSTSNLIALSFLLKTTHNAEKIICIWVQWIIEETFSQSSHTRILTELSDKKRDEWKSITIQKLMQKIATEIDVSVQKQGSSNAYLMRGFLSVRVASALIGHEETKKKILCERDKVETMNIVTLTPPKKNDLIKDIAIGLRTNGTKLEPINNIEFQELNSMSFKLILENMISKGEKN